MKTFIFLYFLGIGTFIKAQELKRISNINTEFGEIYYVLKQDKSIKQGQYLKYYETMKLYDKAIDAYGEYDNNKKTGVWIYCDVENPLNPLVSIGEYVNDKKVGQWAYFYRPHLEMIESLKLAGKNKHTQVVLPTKDNEKFKITLDTIGIRIAVIGNYDNNKKTGIWNYYFQDGSLAYKYDFSTNTIINNNVLNSYDQCGAIGIFKTLFHKSFIEKKVTSKPFFFQNSKAEFEIAIYNDSISISKVNSTGSKPFIKCMQDIIDKMSLDWINYDPKLEQNKLQFQINYIIDGNIGTVTLDSIKTLLPY
jgi:antitoxin component YwqK of YwqJK toxin-antitoxin module